MIQWKIIFVKVTECKDENQEEMEIDKNQWELIKDFLEERKKSSELNFL
jgi:hypothetical protein